MSAIKVGDILAGQDASLQYRGASSKLARAVLVAASLAVSGAAGGALADDGPQIEMTGSPAVMARAAAGIALSKLVISGVEADVAGAKAGPAEIDPLAETMLKYRLMPAEMGFVAKVRSVVDAVSDPLGELATMRFSENTWAVMEAAGLEGSPEKCIQENLRSGLVATLKQCLSATDVAVGLGTNIAKNSGSAMALGQGAIGTFLMGPSQLLGGIKSAFIDQARTFDKAVDWAVSHNLPGFSSGRISMPDGTRVVVRYDAWSDRNQTGIDTSSTTLYDREEFARYEALTLNPAVASLEGAVERAANASRDHNPDFFAAIKEGRVTGLPGPEAAETDPDDIAVVDDSALEDPGFMAGEIEEQARSSRPSSLAELSDFVKARQGLGVPLPQVKPAVLNMQTDHGPDANDDLSGPGSRF